MIDIKFLRKNIDYVTKVLENRHYNLDKDKFITLENNRKKLQVNQQNLQSKQKKLSKEINDALRESKSTNILKSEVKKNQEKLNNINSELSIIQEKLNTFLLDIPNIPDSSVHLGNNENDNKVISKWGNIRNIIDPLSHIEIGSKNNLLDFEKAGQLSGARFVIIKGKLARLHRALIQFMLDTHTEKHNYQEIYAPNLVNENTITNTGQLPKFADDIFTTTLHNEKEKQKKFYLIPTAEVSLTNLVKNEIISEKQLPLKFVSHSTCYRKEAGSYGRDTKGMIRQHQFDKVELIHICHPKKSFDALEEMTNNAENILKALELPFQKVLLCSGDMGFSATKTYDLEAWLPSQNKYREISSCSNCLDFQSRRMKARFKNENSNSNELLHTLNGSGLAVGRALVAIIENYQQKDGSIKIPNVLLPYMAGIDIIK